MSAALTERVLAALLARRGEPLSGQAMAGQLEVTRAAVWKSIKALKAEGYEIESLPTRGYRLAGPTGELRPAELESRLSTSRIGRTVLHLERTDSTNREAARWAGRSEDAAPEGALVVADEQTAGRGRLGRAWYGNPGDTLMLSLVLRPPLPATDVGLITFVTGIAAAETVARWFGEAPVELKWPNDVLLLGRKVAGILLESRIEGAMAEYVIAGIGINVRGSRAQMPEEFRALAAVMAEELSGAPENSGPERGELTPLSVAVEFLEAFERVYDEFLAGGFEAVLPRWERFFRMESRPVTVTGQRGVTSGVVAGMSPEGALLVDTGGGVVAKVHSGDVAFSTTKAPPAQ